VFSLQRLRTAITFVILTISLIANVGLIRDKIRQDTVMRTQLFYATRCVHSGLNAVVQLADSPTTDWNDPKTRIYLYNSLQEVVLFAGRAYQYAETTDGHAQRLASSMGQLGWMLKVSGKHAQSGYIAVATRILLSSDAISQNDVTAIRGLAQELRAANWPRELVSEAADDRAFEPLESALAQLLASECTQSCGVLM
jgi:hypothetical protein